MTTRLTPPLAGLLLCGLLLAPAASAAPAQKPDFLRGCIPCHGLDGIGRDAEIPNLAGQNEVYLYNQLRAFQKGRRPHKEMLYMSRKMNNEDIRALAACFSRLPPR